MGVKPDRLFYQPAEALPEFGNRWLPVSINDSNLTP